MKSVRPITWIGFILSLIAVLSVGLVDLRFGLIVGLTGMLVSLIALATAK